MYLFTTKNNKRFSLTTLQQLSFRKLLIYFIRDVVSVCNCHRVIDCSLTCLNIVLTCLNIFLSLALFPSPAGFMCFMIARFYLIFNVGYLLFCHSLRSFRFSSSLSFIKDEYSILVFRLLHRGSGLLFR